MSLLKRGGDWQVHPQGLYIGKPIELKPTKNQWGDRIRWIFETNKKGEDGQPLKVSITSGYSGLGNEKAWLERILAAFGFDTSEAYWTSFGDLSGFDFLISEGHRLGLEVKHFDKEDGTVGDYVAEVMTLDALEKRKAELRASLDEGDSAPRLASNGNGHGPAPSQTARPGFAGTGPAKMRPVAAGSGAPHPADVAASDPFADE
jgi:hypothetical protein